MGLTFMLKQSKKMLLCLFMGVFCIFSRLEAEEEGATQAAMVNKKSIASFAETMEIFPLDIIADGGYPFGGGPLTRRGRAWVERYELTFEHYRKFYEFKEFALSISKGDFVKIIEGFKSATPKEKALIMTMIYIYERAYRKRTSSHRGSTYTRYNDDHFFRFDNKKTIFFETRWEEWVSLIESRKDDRTVVFPAVITDEKVLKMKWEEDTEKTVQQLDRMLSSSGLSELCEQLISELSAQGAYIVSAEKSFTSVVHASPNVVTSYVNSKEKQPFSSIKYYHLLCEKYGYEKIKPVEVFAEFFSWQKGPPMGYGTAPPMGNSSAKPKTLGDIATQILMSRLSYEEE